ncbi:MAG TPA: NAD(P)/FAD-dependent oxidoreductase [Microthrixaceae bacterium]|jgi:cation diffusion facilitator CzcD-associated flavoprotein CzcO|nr:NAD(P)/FAD-dependent oxidoreductase [Microthrixaceae bacterium]HQF94775.1 NAD(P)/FAD-dependent oxidoreductase [Microthrixaceae bacterium]
MTTPEPSAIESAKERYEAERAKRLRSEGLAQYESLRDHDLDRDPWADPDFTRDPVVEDVQVVVLGGGWAGMLAGINLVKRGITNFRIVEKAADFGGTWYWNRYPGCMCDVDSTIYLPLLEETGYMPTEKYASASEIFGYAQLLGRHFGLYDHALFQTEVESLVWDDDAHRWDITTQRGDRIRTQFFVAAGGLMHKAKLPGIAGIDDFTGKAFHTTRWDYEYTGGSPTEPMDRLADKVVGIIGTGATSVQIVPQLARSAKEVYVFQRTPSAVGVRAQQQIDEEWFRSLKPGWQLERTLNFTSVATGQQPDRDLVADGWGQVLKVDTQREPADDAERAELEAIDFEIMEGFRRRIDEVVEDPETAAKLKPWYGKHCKRICFHDEYLQSFNLPNVHLVDTDGQGVREMSPAGPIVDGTEYPLDLLVFASGFEITTGLVDRLGFDPVGRGGVKLSERWHDGTHSLHGILTAEIPNFFVVSFVQAGFGLNFVHFLSESTKHIVWMIDHCLEEGIASIETTVEAEDEWLNILWQASGPLARYNLACTPSYGNSEGARTMLSARSAVFPGPLMDYAAHLERWRDEGTLAGAKIVRAEESSIEP